MDWKRKLTSRKFWMALATFVSMLVVFMRGTEETAKEIAALIVAGGTVIAYIIGEGLADAAGAAGAGVADINITGELFQEDKPPAVDKEVAETLDAVDENN